MCIDKVTARIISMMGYTLEGFDLMEQTENFTKWKNSICMKTTREAALSLMISVWLS